MLRKKEIEHPTELEQFVGKKVEVKYYDGHPQIIKGICRFINFGTMACVVETEYEVLAIKSVNTIIRAREL